MRDKRAVDFRIDFRFVPVRNDDGTTTVYSIPDPNRYERVNRRGRWYLKDRYAHLLLDEERVMESVAEALTKLPMRYEPAAIGDQTAWVNGREDAIRSQLNGEGQPSAIGSVSHEDLIAGLDVDRAFAIATVSIHNLVGLSSMLNERLAALNATLAHELALAAHLHRGSLWRASAGTYSFFFPAPNLITKLDLALGFATTARDLLRLVNVTLAETSLPTIAAGIGVEAGTALAHLAGLTEHHTEVGLAGLVVAAAEELGNHAPADAVWIGPKGADICHISWRRLMEAVEPQPEIDIPGPVESRGTIYRLSADAHGTNPLIDETDDPQL